LFFSLNGCDVNFQSTTSATFLSEVETISSDERYKTGAAWSPDGSKIAYSLSKKMFELEKIHIDSLNSWKTARIVVNTQSASISHDGNQIAYTNQDDGFLWIANLQTDEKRLLVALKNIFNLTWSRDGEWLAYIKNDKVWYLSTSAGSPTMVPGSPGSDSQPTWSADNGQIAFISTYGKSRSTLWAADLLTGSSEQLTADSLHASAPDWSPSGYTGQGEEAWLNGAILHLQPDSNGVDNIFLLNPHTKSAKQITVRSAHCREPQWSPNGDKIAYHRRSYLRIVTVNGDSLAELDFSAGIRGYKWSPDSDEDAFLYSVQNQYGTVLEVVSVFNKFVKRANHISETPTALNPAWFPDSRELLFTGRDKNSSRNQLYQYSLTTEETKPILKVFFLLKPKPTWQSLPMVNGCFMTQRKGRQFSPLQIKLLLI